MYILAKDKLSVDNINESDQRYRKIPIMHSTVKPASMR